MKTDNRKIHIHDYYRFGDTLRRVDNIINTTTELYTTKTKIFYAIDFSELYSYAFKFGDIESLEKGGWESSERLLIRERLTLEALFSKFGPLVILPPHVNELQEYIKSQTSNLGAFFDYAFFNLIKNKIIKSNCFLPLTLFLKEKISNKQTLAKEEIDNINNIIKDVFGEIKYFHSFIKLINLFKINRLFIKENLIGLKDFLITIENDTGFFLDLNEDQIANQSVIWYEEFLKVISKRSKAYKNPKEIINKERDAIACSYIKHINTAFRENEINAYLSFVSRSNLTLDVLDLHAKEFYNGITFRPSRNLESIYFINTLFDNKVRNEASYSNFKKILQHLLNLREKYKTDRLDYIDDEEVDNISKDIEIVYNQLLDRSNIEIFLHEETSNYSELDKLLKSKEDKSIYNLYNSLISISQIDTEINSDLGKYLKNTNYLNSSINKLTAIQQLFYDYVTD